VFYTFLLLSAARAASGRHCEDRCSLKQGNECYSDPKCIWDPSSSDPSFLEGARSGLADKVCSKVAAVAKAAHEEDNVEEIFTTEAICSPFCEDLVATNCTQYMLDSMLGGDTFEIDNPEVLRKLQEVFDSGDLAQTRTILQSAEPSVTVDQFYQEYMQCEMCEECREDPAGFMTDMRIFNVADEDMFREKCHMAFHTDDHGDCSSRCNPEHLDPLDCHKEAEYCNCPATDESSDTKGEDSCVVETLDMICAFKPENSDSEVETTCSRFMEQIVDIEPEISTNPHAVCRAFCPENFSQCLPGPHHTSSSEDSTNEEQAFGRFQCSICERCKADPTVFIESMSTESCVSTLQGFVEQCSSMTEEPKPLSKDLMCNTDSCAPIGEAQQCYLNNEKDACVSARGCRWMEHDGDPFGDTVDSRMSDWMMNTGCERMKQVIVAMGENPQRNSQDVCRETLGCNEILEVCGMFMDGQEEEDDDDVFATRKLLSFVRDLYQSENQDLGHTAKYTGKPHTFTHKTSRIRRKLLQNASAQGFDTLAIDEFVPTIFSCATCSICEEEDMLQQMQEISEMPSHYLEDFLQGCREGANETDTTEQSSSCRPVCSTIPPINCGLYPDYCECSTDRHYEDTCYDDRGRPVNCDEDRSDYHHTGVMSCHCEPNLYGKNGCELQKDGTCSKGCSPMSVHNGSFYSHHDMQTVQTINEVVHNEKTSGHIADVTVEELCTEIHACSDDCSDDEDDCVRCQDCIKDERTMDVVTILHSANSSDSNITLDVFSLTTSEIGDAVTQCVPDVCHTIGPDEGTCHQHSECVWACYSEEYSGGDIFSDIREGFNSTSTQEECFCSPDEDLERTCTYENGNCGKGCERREGLNMEWKEVVSPHFEQNLIYVSMLTSRYKLESMHQGFGWEQRLTPYDVCTWIDHCYLGDGCKDVFESADSGGEWKMECDQCSGCMTAKPVIEILELFKHRSQSEWDGGLREIAREAAEEDAAREFCRPTACDSFDDQESCAAESQCRYECHHRYDDHDDRSSAGDGGEGDDGCLDFMLHWKQNIRNPGDFCADEQRDVSEQDCLNTMSFFRQMTDFGHFQTFNERRKLCNVFGDGFPTTATIKQRLGGFFCDPSQQCCGSVSKITDSGIVLPEDKCKQKNGCQFSRECVPVKDRCYESVVASSRNTSFDGVITCSSGCTFVPSSNLLSVETVHGRGLCIDLLLEETCKWSAMEGCWHEDCMLVPSCTVESGKDFGCLGGDTCCVPTLDGVITATECSRDGCALNKKCVKAFDDCGYFHNEWECNFNKACQFVPLKNAYDRSAGQCVSKTDRCEKRTRENCERSPDCILIDSCEKSVCDNEDRCCPLSEQECRRDPGCARQGTCKVRDEFDICAYYESQDTCPTSDELCDWKKETSTCKMHENPCSHFTDGQECEYSEMCVFEKACVDACSVCKDCVTAFGGLVSSVTDDMSIQETQQIFISSCLANGYDFFTCFRTGQKVARSGGKWAKRPGAICLDLGSCLESCQETDTDARLSRCSATGWDTGQTTTAAVDECKTCTKGQYCKRSNAVEDERCTCNPQTGFDSCRPGGICVDRCEKYKTKIAEYNSYVTSCSEDNPCDENFNCDTSVTSRTMTCSNGDVNIVATNGACVPDERSMITAKFNDYGSVINVELNFPAMSRHFPCSLIFDSATRTLLGQSFCVVHGTSMSIFLRFGAKIKPGDTLKLATGQQKLISIANRVPFGNSATDVVVQNCDLCAEPSVMVNYPPRISGGCFAGDAPRVRFDGSFTSDLTGRELQCVWTVDSSNCYRATNTETTFESCPVLRSAADSQQGRILELDSEVVEDLADKPGFYNMRLTCTNFLEKSNSYDIEFEVIGVPLPLISAPKEVTYLRSEGLVIPVSISQKSVCPGDVVVYNWTSPDFEIPNGFLARKDFRMNGYDSSIPGTTYSLQLEAKLRKADGSERDGQSVALVAVTPEPSPVKSILTGPTGDVVLSQDIVLQSLCNDPDDAENIEGSFELDYFCVRGNEAEADLSFDDSETQPCEALGTFTESNITLATDSLTKDVWYIYTLTCSKSDRVHSSTITFRPRSATSEIPTGQVVQLCSGDCPESHDPMTDLKLQLKNPAYEDTSITWSCPSLSEALTSEQVQGGIFNGARFTILGGTLTAVDSIDCVAELVRNDLRGQAWIQIQINSAPYCSAEDSCVGRELVSADNEFPDAKYQMSCSDFADDQEEAMTFSFGCILPDGSRRIFIKSPQSYYVFSSLSIGRHDCFACAIDKHKTEVCETFELEVAEPSDGISVTVLNSALDDVTTAENSGDIHALLQTVGTVVNLVEYASENELISSGGEPAPAPAPAPSRRRLLSSDSSSSVTISSVVQPLVTTLGDFDPFDQEAFRPVVTQFVELAPDLEFTNLNVIADTVERGLEASFLADATYVTGDANQLATDVANILSYYAVGWSIDYDSLEAFQTYTNLQGYAEDLVCMNLALGDSHVVESSASDIWFSCLKESPESLNGATFDLNDVSVTFPTDFSTACGEECPTTLELHVSSTEQTSIHIDFIGSPVPMVDAADPAVLSEIVSLNVEGLDSDSLCSEPGCTLSVKVPVSSFNSSKITACMRIDGTVAVGGEDDSGIEYVTGSYSSTEQSVTCEVSNLGDIFVVQYVDSSASLTEDSQSSGGNSDAEEEEKIVTAQLRFADLDFDEYANDEDKADLLKDQISSELLASPLMNGASYEVVELRRGSVVAVVEITLPSSADQASIDQLVTDIETEPEALFSSSFTDEYGTPSLRVTSAPGMEPEEEKKDEDDKTTLVIIVVACIAGVVLSAVVLFACLKACCRSGVNFQDVHATSYLD
jgi:hypothetical protein